jgi:acetoin utilization protein AcuB
MVFIWVNTGVVEPYIPHVSTQMKVPELFPTQQSSKIENEISKNLIPNTIHSNAKPQSIYKANDQALDSGDPVSYVYEIMSNPVFTLPMTQKFSQVHEIFRKKKFRHIPIINEKDQMIGIVSDRDVLRSVGSTLDPSTPILELMRNKVLSVEPDTLIRESAKVMLNERIGCLPVLSPTQELKGIITRSDILRVIIHKPYFNLFA